MAQQRRDGKKTDQEGGRRRKGRRSLNQKGKEILEALRPPPKQPSRFQAQFFDNRNVQCASANTVLSLEPLPLPLLLPHLWVN